MKSRLCCLIRVKNPNRFILSGNDSDPRSRSNPRGLPIYNSIRIPSWAACGASALNLNLIGLVNLDLVD
jgi:hypothetical protein